MNKKILIVFILIPAIIIVIAGAWVFWPRQESETNIINQCSNETKLCPDGSEVSRLFPGCEFAECVNIDDTAEWKVYKNTELGFEIKYPDKYEVVTDQYAYPNSIILFIEKPAAQAYRAQIDLWDNIDDFYKHHFPVQSSFITTLGNKYLTIYYYEGGEAINNEWEKIISTLKINYQKSYQNNDIGFEFKYPEILLLGTQIWPPEVIIAPIPQDFSCQEDKNIKTTFGYGERKIVIIGDRNYCMTMGEDGSAGTSHFTYQYVINKDNKQITFKFGVSKPNCGALGDDEKILQCETMQNNFDPDTLIDSIFSTFQFIK